MVLLKTSRVFAEGPKAEVAIALSYHLAIARIKATCEKEFNTEGGVCVCMCVVCVCGVCVCLCIYVCVCLMHRP